MKRRKKILLALDWYNPDIHRGVSDFAKKHNWNVAVFEHFTLLKKYHQIDGIIGDMNLDFYRDWAIENEIKMVHIGLPYHDLACDSVAVDHQKSAKLAADYFMNKGYTSYVWFTDKASDRSLRYRYYAEWLQPKFDCEKIYHPVFSEDHLANKNFITQLCKRKLPIAVFASDDNAAASKLINFCLDNGLQVPEDVAILGVHNDPLISQSVSIPISSIDVDFYRLGYLASNLLDRRIEEKTNKVRTFLIPPRKLIIRQSTDAIVVDHPEVLKALKFMKEHFHNGITVKDIVLKTKFTECGLNKAFKEHLSLTIGQKLREFKIDYASELLRETEIPIKEIAIKSGFGDYYGFFEAFKRAKNCTPKQFRES